MGSPTKRAMFRGPHVVRHVHLYMRNVVELLKAPVLPMGPSMPCDIEGLPPFFVVVEATDAGNMVVRFPYITSLKGEEFKVSWAGCQRGGAHGRVIGAGPVSCPEITLDRNNAREPTFKAHYV